MKNRHRFFLLAAGAVLLTACQTIGGTQNVLLKTGSTVEQRRAAIDACQVKSLQEVPPSYKTTSVRSPRFGPSYCYGYSCGFYNDYSTRVVSVDPNEKLRARRFEGCLRSKGYNLAPRPTCSETAAANDYRNRKRQAPASQVTCVADEPRIQSRWIPR